MTDKSAIAALKERVEKASGPDRELDFLIQIHVAQPLTGDEWYSLQDVMDDFALLGPEGMTIDAPWTASIDASLALVERLLPGWTWMMDHQSGYTCVLWRDKSLRATVSEDGATAPLAIILALLSALGETPMSTTATSIARSTIKRDRAALRKVWKSINGTPSSSVDDEGLFLLAAAQVGTRKYVRIAELAGISRSRSLQLSRRAREAGLIRNKEIHHSGWLDQESGGVAFICDVLVLAGQFERVSP